ncbi:hypothetical protein ABID82_004804 [Methylobacterium sp. PvP062]|jgi:hypothetical protein|uniref:Cbb3-type cytochrome oxidase assembly protein CcoS n=1 Tax=Methylobacterium radiotolerans TaxID=31998 RepID=A0ABV2N8J5_9HYPH|nr:MULTISPECIES: hypothetical protein [Methylobacterium]MCX7332756.1 hypothetical protein [Hyphomicrobiales bacterium]GAN52270.1 hypothetical protein ME121_6397 [Methylobacterium sp. ME121]KTS07746.1 hypothetical protein SB3_16935 [Methylobacterium radiotolerans]KTS43820.1 hypothetical protein SB2_26580 [Methylobacterium radiotolerans]MBN6823683.1 hypothetical protein [Methylobacterium organophilum]
MSIAILIAFVAGALCLGILSALIPFGRREAEEPDEALPYEDEFLDLGGPVIDLEPRHLT